MLFLYRDWKQVSQRHAFSQVNRLLT